MAKLAATAALFFALVGVALATPLFTIEGRVYCDNCRAGFETSLTKYIEGATVKLECKNFETGKVNYTAEAVTDSTGTYKLEAYRNHDEDICEVVLVKSSDVNCAEIQEGRDRALVVLTQDSGISSDVRYANPLGFFVETPLAECGMLLQKYALGADD